MSQDDTFFNGALELRNRFLNDEITGAQLIVELEKLHISCTQSATHDALVHEVCDRFRAAAGQPACEKCMREADTPYGPGMIGCYLVAEETIELVRKETQSAITATRHDDDCNLRRDDHQRLEGCNCSLAVYTAVRLAAEGSDWKRDSGESLATWASRALKVAQSATAPISPPTKDEIAAYRDLFRAELNKRMDTRHPSASPSTEAHEIALRNFVETRNQNHRADSCNREKP